MARGIIAAVETQIGRRTSQGLFLKKKWKKLKVQKPRRAEKWAESARTSSSIISNYWD
jgi:hypothetical protein